MHVCHHHYHLLKFSSSSSTSSTPVPSAAPTPISIGSTTSRITVQWGGIDCVHHNGDLTGYIVRHGVQQSADRTVEMATGDSSGGMYTISRLSAATEYTVEVAAVNSAGVGVYSDPIVAMTDGEY